MKKASIKLFEVHSSCKVKFSVTIESDPLPSTAKERKAFSKYTVDNSEYYVVDAKSYVVIDFAKKNDPYSTFTNFALDRRRLFSFILRLERVYRSFTEERELFFLDELNGQGLTLNKDLAKKHTETMQISQDKRIEISPILIKDPNSDLSYEGIYIAINSLSYYTLITYDQLEFLIFELKKIDFGVLEMQLINLTLLAEKEEAKEIQRKTVQEVVVEEIKDTKRRVHIEEPSEIPNI